MLTEVPVGLPLGPKDAFACTKPSVTLPFLFVTYPGDLSKKRLWQISEPMDNRILGEKYKREK